LNKALYGLKQAPRAWNTKLNQTLRCFGFIQSPLEHGLYARGEGDDRLLVGAYVDDLIIVGSSSRVIKGFKEQMKAKFRMSDLGVLSFYLGIEVRQGEKGITLCQSSYAQSVVDKAGLEGCNPCATPMEPKLKLSRESSALPIDGTLYRSLVGSLQYLVNTRPDISYSTGYVSHFMEKPTHEHLGAVKRIIRYIAGTIRYGVQYGREEEWKLIGFSDSDLSGDVDTKKSTSGIIFFLGYSLVSWKSQKQKVVALSSCEAEYIVVATAACQGIWLARLLGDLKNTTVGLKVDNKSALALIKRSVFHERSKHIQIRFHFIRESSESGEIIPNFISTGNQLRDIWTKTLP
jgi:hypothetical protein